MKTPANIPGIAMVPSDMSLGLPVELRLVLSGLVLGIIAGCGPPF
jgi:hypothetical protein